MTFQFNYLLLAVITVVSVSGCKKFVEIAPPESQLVTASVFSTNAAATVAQTGIYTQMFNQSYNISRDGGLLADEFTNYSTAIPVVQQYRNQMIAASSYGQWDAAYNYIYQENAILEALANNSALSTAVVRQLTGEALFMRAFWHFYLTNCWGAVPLVTTTDYTVNDVISRTPRPAVMEQIIADLQKAQSLLNSNFVNGDDTSSDAHTERVRPTKWAATALLARTYLYTGNWAGADSAASAVIGNSSLFNLVGLDSVFLANSQEAIWQLQTPTPTTKDTKDGTFYILTSAPNTAYNSSVTLSPQLLGAFEPGDLRYTDWVDSATFGSAVYYFPFKYKVGSQKPFSGTVTEYTMVLRLGEQYLIRAEAEAQLNQLTAAATDLNIIRSRAGLGGTAATTQAEMLTAVLHERQVELFTEWGHRWFDLIRTGAVDTVLGPPGNVAQFKNGTWVATDTLYPVSQNQINNNSHLSQNAGY